MKSITEIAANFLSLASLEDEIAKLDVSDEVKDYIFNLPDPKLKGKLFSQVKKDPNITLEQLKQTQEEVVSKQQKKEQAKQQEIPEDWKNVFNSIQNEKLKQFLHLQARTGKLPEFNERVSNQIERISHYLQENPTAFIDKYDFGQLAAVAEEWEESFKEAEQTVYEKTEVVYGPRWQNENFNGNYIVEITTEGDLKLEGKLLNHCVGGYWHFVNTGTKRIFSLRNSSNLPMVTIETSPDLYHFAQTFGVNNSQPTQLQNSMINEWKQSLHPAEKIKEMAQSEDVKSRIKASQFMDYNDPIFSDIIFNLVMSEEDSQGESLGIFTSNEPQDVLQALAANETLNPSLYYYIYEKAKGNESTVFNLARNPSIDDDLFVTIFQDHKDKENILAIIGSSFNLAESSKFQEVADYIVSANKNKPLLSLLNNPSIKSSFTKDILSNLPSSKVDSLLSKDVLPILEPKLVDDIIEAGLEEQYVKLLFNENINEKHLTKLYKKLGFEPIKVSREDLLEKQLEKEPLSIGFLLPLKKIPAEMIDGLLDNKEENAEVWEDLSQNPNLQPRHIDKLLQNQDVWWHLAQNPNLEPQHIDKLLQEGSIWIWKPLAKNPNLQPRHIDKLLQNQDVWWHLAQNPNLEPQHIDKLLQEGNIWIWKPLAKNPNLEPQHIDKLLQEGNIWVWEHLAENPNLEPQHIDKLLQEGDVGVWKSLAENPNLQPKHIDKLLQEGDIRVLEHLAKNPNLEPQHIDKILQEGEDWVWKPLAKNPNLEPQHIDKLLQEDDIRVWWHLAENPYLQPKHIDKLLQEGDIRVWLHLAENPSLQPQHIDKLLQEGGGAYEAVLTENPNLSKDQMVKLILKGNFPKHYFKVFGNKKEAYILSEITKISSVFCHLSLTPLKKKAATKLDQAFQEGTGMNIVEYSRKLRNASYNEWEKGQRLPSGMARVDIDVRPVGRMGVIFKNYDYAQGIDSNIDNPGLGMHTYQNQYQSTRDFIEKKRFRTQRLQEMARKYDKG